MRAALATALVLTASLAGGGAAQAAEFTIDPAGAVRFASLGRVTFPKTGGSFACPPSIAITGVFDADPLQEFLR